VARLSQAASDRRDYGRATGSRLFPCFLLIVVSLLSGCGDRPSRPPWPLPAVPDWWVPAQPLSHSSLSRVLASALALPANHQLDLASRDLLSSYLATAAHRSAAEHPELFPTREAQIASLVNAHLAWTLTLSQAPELSNLPVEALRDIPVPFAGTSSSLRQIEGRVLAIAVAEPRLGLFLNPGWRGAPALPPAALEGHSLVWQLADHAERCGREAGVWELDSGRATLRISELVNMLPGLPAAPRLRARRALDVMPPPAALRAEILARCGASLQRCTLTVLAVDKERRWRPLALAGPADRG
jgi:hypothetical protein